jgi:hypothetical protein
MKKYIIPFIALAFLAPSAAYAVSDLFGLELFVISILGKLGYLFWVMSIVFFFYGLVKFVNNSTDPAEREKGKSVMLWGIIAFTVLFSLWALVRFILVDTLLINAAPVNYVDKNGTTIP